jgi:hypothetical protein
MKRSLILFISALLSSMGFTASYVVGVENISYYPHYDFNKSIEKQGFARELLDTFAADSGHTLSYQVRPVERLWDEFLQGDVDLKYPDNALWAGDKKADKEISYSQPVIGFTDGVMTSSNNSSLKSLTTVRGFSPWAYLDDINQKKIKLFEQNDVSQIIKFVLAERADGAYSNVDIANYQLNKMGKTGELIFREDLPHSKNSYQLSSISYPELIEEFNQWLINNIETVNALKLKYQLDQ